MKSSENLYQTGVRANFTFRRDEKSGSISEYSYSSRQPWNVVNSFNKFHSINESHQDDTEEKCHQREQSHTVWRCNPSESELKYSCTHDHIKLWSDKDISLTLHLKAIRKKKNRYFIRVPTILINAHLQTWPLLTMTKQR